MFDPIDKARVFGMPPGVDFATSLVTGLQTKLAHLSPADWARVEIYVNTTRMQRRLRAVFDSGPARLLPRVRLVTDLARDQLAGKSDAAASPLRRRLELSKFVARLLDQDPTLAPRAALFDLSDSLATLMEEMHTEGVTPADIAGIDITDESGHWARALEFINIVTPFFEDNATPDKELRLRRVILSKIAAWADTPPTHPIIVAGSTGSRGATRLFMQAVAGLPQGAVILPGFDFDLPHDVWASMDDPLVSEDHPQYRFRNLMHALDIDSDDIAPWDDRDGPSPARNRLISLSLRPAPVTDQWLRDGPDLGDLELATQGMTLVEASDPRAEAETIALRLRQAAQDGITAALITPDRMLTRQVAAALDRWDIRADDSAGLPLQLSPPGRLLRHIADVFGQPITSEALLTLLKHPLVHSGDTGRNQHLLNTRELELHLRRFGPPFPTAGSLAQWAADGPRAAWAAWVGALIDDVEDDATLPLADHTARHLSRAAAFCAGPSGDGSGVLWQERAGREADRICKNLIAHADAGGPMTPREYATVFGAVLAEGVVRDRDAGHPNILIWGTLEARVQSAQLVILGGMNEGIWPEAARPDPWLNRNMRKAAGLLLPERRIGLSAHDYQQAVASSEVWITRAKRDAEAETVPSRWVNRLTNLLGGLSAHGGDDALAQMRSKGDAWLAMAAAVSAPPAQIAPAPRPSPRPPIAARPKEISVTEVKTLIRDPYAVYARRILRLNQLDPLVPSAEAALRGDIIHKILEEFVGAGTRADAPDARDILMSLTREWMAKRCPWPTVRAQWIAAVDRSADLFLQGEIARQLTSRDAIIEKKITHPIGSTGVSLICKADRLDVQADGSLHPIDYKTGGIPSKAEQLYFDKQLLLTAALVELGAFAQVGPANVPRATFVAMNANMRDVPAPLVDAPTSEVWADFQTLIKAFQQNDRGYTARMAMQKRTDISYYDQLARFGEWGTSDTPKPEDLT